MKVHIHQDIANNPQLLSLVRRTNELLEKIAGPAAATVTVEWSRDVPQGWNFVNLAIVDSTGARGTTVLAPGELTREDYLRARLYRVGGDLLEDRSHKQLKALTS